MPFPSTGAQRRAMIAERERERLRQRDMAIQLAAVQREQAQVSVSCQSVSCRGCVHRGLCVRTTEYGHAYELCVDLTTNLKLYRRALPNTRARLAVWAWRCNRVRGS